VLRLSFSFRSLLLSPCVNLLVVVTEC
jgi:hypothetical protein